MIINKEIKQKINSLLNLPSNGNEQDWEIELADSKRINEFLSAISKNKLEFPERYALMCLIFASYDDYLENEKDVNKNLWSKIINVLNEDKDKYEDLLRYWAVWDKIQRDDWFNITALVRAYILS